MSVSLKLTEQNLKFSQNSLFLLNHWMNYLNTNTHLAKAFYKHVSNFQTKQAGQLVSFSEKQETIFPVPLLFNQFQRYSIDFSQRAIIFWDILRQRGNQYIEYIQAGYPPVLIFKYNIIVDGRTLPHPVNYALVEILPPPTVTIDANKRPFLIVDPRAGHGAGIGGFKDDSQVGIALRAGHPVYFVIFFPDPEPQQNLRDIAMAEKHFAETIIQRHPNSPKPCIIGNCQGGWAVMALAAAKPELAGALVINGAPISYWAGEQGKNPMRYAGGLIGGSWLVQLMSDLGNGKFDGANLVSTFEELSPDKTHWEKYYQLFTNLDNEKERFLNFERWWGGFYSLNADEIRSVVDNLFIGNYLSHGRIRLNRSNHLDLRNIHCPIIIFCSEGDDITSTQQALNWIADIYENDLQIKIANQVIIYMVHRTIGHLGIFVSSKVAVKEHKEIIDLLDYVNDLPPGLYEMLIEENANTDPGQSKHLVVLKERSISDIVDKQHIEYREEADIFRTLRTTSRCNSQIYDLYFAPTVRILANEPGAELMRQLHPLRVSRYLISDLNPLLTGLPFMAKIASENRQPITGDNIFLEMQQDAANLVTDLFKNYKANRDNLMELAFYAIYKPLSIILSDALMHEEKLHDTEFEHEKKPEANINAAMKAGGVIDAIVRILLLIKTAQKFLHGHLISPARKLLLIISGETDEELQKKINCQNLLIAYDNELALQTLLDLIRTPEERVFVINTLKDFFTQVPIETDDARDTWKRIERFLGKQRKKKGVMT